MRSNARDSEESRTRRQRELPEAQDADEVLMAQYTDLLNADVAMVAGDAFKPWQIEHLFSPRLKVRADLLRKAEHLPTIEEAFPALRQFVDKKAIDTEEILRAFAAGTISSDDVRAAGQLLSAPDTLSDEQRDACIAACEQLAMETGYEVFEYDFGLTEEKEPSLVLRRNGLTFDITITFAPSIDGIYRGSHISDLVTRSQLSFRRNAVQKRASIVPSLTYSAFEEGGWFASAEDTAIQREIDRVVAIFG